MSQCLLGIRKTDQTDYSIYPECRWKRENSQRIWPTALFVAGLSAALLTGGCKNISLPQIIFESPTDGRDEGLKAYEEVTEVSHLERTQDAWFKVYVQASSLTQDERQARLLALNSVLGQPDQNQTYLALEQATLLGVNKAPHKQWRLATQILASMPAISPDTDAAIYKSWLQTELELRLNNTSQISSLAAKNAKQAEQIKQLKTEIEGLNERIASLNDQINALTNIEQNLTEKKVSQ
jgi:hypothetical protein